MTTTLLYGWQPLTEIDNGYATTKIEIRFCEGLPERISLRQPEDGPGIEDLDIPAECFLKFGVACRPLSDGWDGGEGEDEAVQGLQPSDWVPTHRIVFCPDSAGFGESEYYVQLTEDGAAYSCQEWHYCDQSAWSQTQDGWLFQGESTPHRVNGTVIVEAL